ncbi:MAG: DUF222 domain-containing protein [Luteitalea sp.]|nr:DUF222 domain-containing protein [Luteitalea sp.]
MPGCLLAAHTVRLAPVLRRGKGAETLGPISRRQMAYKALKYRGLSWSMSSPERLPTTPGASILAPLAHDSRAADDEELERLADAIAELSARIQAAIYDLLVLIRQFDARAGWHTGFTSCAHWLSWRTGLELGAAREKVRVARALATLPVVSAAMHRGELSYSKVRALTRVATPANETRLVDAARSGTAAHIERLVRAWRRVDRQAEARETAWRHEQRHLATWVDEDGMVVIRGRLTPELGAVVQRALEAAADQLFREEAAVPSDDGPTEVTPAQRRADALGLVAESALASDLDRGTAGDRYQVVIHVDQDTLKEDAGWTGSVSVEPDTGQAVLEDADGAYVSAETSRRIACDASTVVMRHASDGTVLDVGRKRRTIPPAIRRALAARDRRCRFPGCTARHCEAHHVQHWADGGPTRLENLVLLCKRHHRAVHEEGFTLTRRADGTVGVCRPDGRPLPASPPVPRWDDGDRHVGDPLAPIAAQLAAADIQIGPQTATPHWHGEPLDVGWAIDVLWDRPGGVAASGDGSADTCVGT